MASRPRPVAAAASPCNFRDVLDQFSVLKSAPSQLWLIFLMKGLECYAYFSMTYMLTVFLSQDFAMSDEAAGLTYGWMNALTALYGLPAGFMIIDVIGVKWSLVLSNILLMSARLLLAFTTNTSVAVFVLYFLMPLGQALNIPVLTIAVRRYTNDNSRSIAFSWFYVVLNVAALLAAPAVDVMRTYVGGACVEIKMFAVPCFSAYRAIIFSGFVATAINFFLSMKLPLTKEVAMGKGPSSDAKTPSSPWANLTSVLKNAVFWKFFAFVLFLTGVRLIYRHMDATFPKYMLRMFGPDAPFGSILSINPVVVILFVPIFGALFRKIPAFNVILAGAIISGCSSWFLLIGPNYWNIIVWITVLSIGESLWSPRLYEYSATISPPGQEGTYMSLSQFPLFAAPLVAGAMSGDLLSRYCPRRGMCDPYRLWFWIAVVSMASPVLMVLFSPFLRAKTHEESSAENLEGNEQEFDAEGSMQLLPDSDSDVSEGDMREEDEEEDESERVGSRSERGSSRNLVSGGIGLMRRDRIGQA